MEEAKVNKWGIKNIAKSFGNATSSAFDKIKENQRYKKSDEYKQKVLDNMDYKIEMQKKLNKIEELKHISLSNVPKQRIDNGELVQKEDINSRATKQTPMWEDFA